MLAAIVFYVFAAILVASAAMVIVARNPVHSVLFLILCFFNAAGLFVLMGAEFLAMILVVVYVGAVAVLFLFVVMMLDVDFVKLREGFARYLPVGAAVGLVLAAELVFVLAPWAFSASVPEAISVPIPDPGQIHNTKAIGLVLYTDYAYLFQAAGLVLLVAMVGAIVLTLRDREGVKRQSIARQVARTRAEGVETVSVKSREGVDV
ncbi:MAG: NADH-quinone oxidoreductase subunit J [Magnetospirillum sp.]|jgi:NADH-quinone oxidoreductase subunit J|nr:NADH-quinone oxidoreductase subunit J [Magnetospirillum sp.]